MITIGDSPGDASAATTNSIRLTTGKGLNEWFTLLDAWQGDKRKLYPLTHHLIEQHRLEYGCAQVIALHYLCKRL